MTVKELYNYCVKNHCENKMLTIDYTCNDCWYDYYEQIKWKDIKNLNNEVAITVSK